MPLKTKRTLILMVLTLIALLLGVTGTGAVLGHNPNSVTAKEVAALSTADEMDYTRNMRENSVVRFKLFNYKEPESATTRGCTGVVVDPHWVLTVKHCVDESIINATNPEPIYVSIGDVSWNDARANDASKAAHFRVLSPSYASAVIEHPTLDLSLVHVPQIIDPAVAPAVPISEFKLNDNDPVWSYGWGSLSDDDYVKSLLMVKEDSHKYTNKLDKADPGDLDKHNVYTPSKASRDANLAIVGGDSGGPIVRARTGELVGLNAVVVGWNVETISFRGPEKHEEWLQYSADLSLARSWVISNITPEV